MAVTACRQALTVGADARVVRCMPDPEPRRGPSPTDERLLRSKIFDATAAPS